MRTPAGAGHVQPFALPSSSYDWRLPERSIRVWTPRSYESSPDRRYPTLYCHDGQHLMAEAWKSWRLHVTLSELIDEGTIEEPIVVMIDHVGPLMPGDVGPEMLPLVRRRWLESELTLPLRCRGVKGCFGVHVLHCIGFALELVGSFLPLACSA